MSLRVESYHFLSVPPSFYSLSGLGIQLLPHYVPAAMMFCLIVGPGSMKTRTGNWNLWTCEPKYILLLLSRVCQASGHRIKTKKMKIKCLIHWLPPWLCQPSHSSPFEVVNAFISSFKTQSKFHPFLIQPSRERFLGVWLSLAVQQNRQCYIYITPCPFSAEPKLPCSFGCHLPSTVVPDMEQMFNYRISNSQKKD